MRIKRAQLFIHYPYSLSLNDLTSYIVFVNKYEYIKLDRKYLGSLVLVHKAFSVSSLVMLWYKK